MNKKVPMRLKMEKLAATLLPLLALACSSEDVASEGSDYLTDTPVSICVGGIETRVGYNTGYVIEEGSLGFWLNQSGTQYDAENLEVKYASGEWTAQGSLLWKNATDEVEYVASYPYEADGVYEVSLPSDQSSSDMLSSDVLYAEGLVRGEDGAVNIVFSHTLAQLKVVLTFGETLGTNPQITSITLSNASLDGTFTVRDADGSCAWSDQGNSGEVTLAENSQAEFECLLIPQTIDDYHVMVKAEVDGIEKLYQFESSNLVLKQGATYTLPLQVGADTSTLALATQTENIAITSDCVIDGSNLTTAYTKQITITGDIEVTLKNVNQIASGDNKDAITINSYEEN